MNIYIYVCLYNIGMYIYIIYLYIYICMHMFLLLVCWVYILGPPGIEIDHVLVDRADTVTFQQQCTHVHIRFIECLRFSACDRTKIQLWAESIKTINCVVYPITRMTIQFCAELKATMKFNRARPRR